jgi:predicted ATPase
LPPHNLPARLTRFIGREEELSQICHLVGGDNPGAESAVTRLLTITGPGGTGKTRLALETAVWLCQNQPKQFPDGLFFVGLAAVTNLDHVVTAVAETVGVQEPSGQPPGRSLLQNLSDQLRPKRLLLLLDNFEHLLDAAPLVSDLLTAVPGLHILVTSQAVLHLYGEYEFPLSPLPLADLDHLPPAAELLKVPAIALFVERLQAARHDFKLTDGNARPVAEICACLDGMPLALELAAARGKLFTPEAMLGQLHSRLHFLSGQARNLPARHQTLRAALDWSYHLLTETEQIFFAALSLFAGSFGFTAVESLFNPDLLEDSLTQRRGGAEVKGIGASFVGLHHQDAAELLASLVDKNMLRQLPDEGDEPRFRMLQTLREYGLEKVGQMETAVQLRLRQQFAAVYVVWTEQAEQGLRSGDQNSWLKRLRLEDANIMAAQEWLFAHADMTPNGLLAARLVATQERYWSLQGRFSEARSWFTQALNYRHLLPADEQVKLINKAGVIAQHQGDYAAAAILHESALNLARQEENPELMANTLHYLGFAAGRQGRYEEARGLLEESLALNQELPDTLPQITTTLNNLAIVLRRLEAYDEAIAILEKALALKREINDQLGIPAVLGNLSQLLSFKGHFAQALAYAKEGLALRQQFQDRPGILVSLSQMADMAIETGQDGRGIRLLAASLTHRQRMNLALTAHVQAETEAEIASLRTRLGDETFAAEWAVGATMSVDEAVAYALAGEG